MTNTFHKTQSRQVAAGARIVVGAAVVATGFYLAFSLVALAWHRWDPTWFIWIGKRYEYLTNTGSTGYDGQFIYYLARDGVAALPHLDNPPYRLQRILLPVLARLLSFGSAAAIPWVIIALNFVAIIGTTYLLAVYLQEHDVSPWYSLVYPLYAGTLMAYSRALTEPLAYGLVTGGVLL